MPFTKNSQAATPLLDALQTCANKPHAAFYAPGHKRGVGISPPLAELLGSAVFQADLPELPELDNLFAPEGVIQSAQQLAADAFGAEHTWFLVNGSTCGVMAAILATCGTGDKIVLPRNVHQSAIAALILSGAIPIFLNPEYDAVLDIAHSITPAAVADALKQHPDAKAVMMLYPTYYGVCGDVGAIAQIAHQYNIPLLVDEAHGPHFTFHPDLPPSALSAGADLTVQSIHKVLGAFTQAAMLHVQGTKIDLDRVSKALQLLQSTSPSYLLLASLDAARQQMALHGELLMTQTLQLANQARTEISQIPGLSVLELVNTPGFVALDLTRLTVTVSGLGLTGFEADEILHQQLGVTAELPSLQHLTFIISLGNTQADIDKLVQAFTTLSKEYARVRKPLGAKKGTELINNLIFTNIPNISPREAFFSSTEVLPVEQTSDAYGGVCQRISAELVCPYPPGIPVLMPGEVITPAAIQYLQQILSLGGNITGCSDPSLKTLKVVQQ
ncbi:MAG: aminotransferase class I/II-fold pyridoxal phosphate-dependent enzyme [Aphanothece sp. CMT-3BRIN-NPC111]|jgi:arginine decarboxylase|nr:aminotransferase class I/II-fold pyridoxal phosphate-dependent enzyme [Aphanothece sp. CMT-3BRIN-NPC111]